MTKVFSQLMEATQITFAPEVAMVLNGAVVLWRPGKQRVISHDFTKDERIDDWYLIEDEQILATNLIW